MVEQWLEIGRLGDWEVLGSNPAMDFEFGIRTFGHSDFRTLFSTTAYTMLQRVTSDRGVLTKKKCIP